MKTKLAITLVLSLLSTQLQAGDAALGKAKADAVCASCHGINGISQIPNYPNLKGQKEQYLIDQLKLFKSKKRNSGMAAIMQPMAAILSDDDINNLAAYYSSLK
jgi:cytochrome c553